MKFQQKKYNKPIQKYQYNQYSNQQQRNNNYYDQSHQNSRYYNTIEQSSPQFKRSPSKQYQQQSYINLPIWQQLYRQGLNSKRILQEQYQLNKNKIDIQCTFQPTIKNNKKYLANSQSTFLQRVHIWQEHKLQKLLKQKGQQVDKSYKQCTFTPKINPSSRRWKEYIQQLPAPRFQKSQLTVKNVNRQLNPYYSPIKKQKQMKPLVSTDSNGKMKPKTKTNNYIELSQAKAMIRSQLRSIAL